MVIKRLYIDLIELKGELIGVIENLLLYLFFFRMKLEAAQPRVFLSPYPAWKNREQAGKWNKLLTLRKQSKTEQREPFSFLELGARRGVQM